MTDKTLTLCIQFAKKCVLNDEDMKKIILDDFKEACKYASKNLYSRHGIIISDPLLKITLTGEPAFLISLCCPEKTHTVYKNPARMLRGLSTYLLHKSENHDLYRMLKYGTRLLRYTIIELPDGGCYLHMFDGCTNLTTAPVLHIELPDGGCYLHMFDGCTNLTTAPVLHKDPLI